MKLPYLRQLANPSISYSPQKWDLTDPQKNMLYFAIGLSYGLLLTSIFSQ
jgi:hypothetical protein